MKLKRVMLTAAALMLIGSMAGCGGKKTEEAADSKAAVQKEKDETKQTKKTEKEEEPAALEGKPVEADKEAFGNENLLTGVADLTDAAIGKRPVAVMVNNVEAAMPQYGVAEADIIFEIPVEGDKTRFMAMYGDYTQVPQVCSVRSCRAYFPAFSQGFDGELMIPWRIIWTR